jgi:hypothetical protein
MRHGYNIVVDPARRATGFHDNQVELVRFEDRCQVAAIGSCIEECMFTSFCVEKAAHRIELTEVESENFHWMVLWVWGGKL